MKHFPLRLSKCPPSEMASLLRPPWSSIVFYFLLEHFVFYATSHQPTFPSIQWHAAFVAGFSGTVFILDH